MNARMITYWVATAPTAFVLISGGVVDVMHGEATLEVVTKLGYPLYFLTILGIWKVLGGLVIVAPGLPRLKEWAYAGTMFDFTGATASHFASNDYGAACIHLWVPLVLTAIALVSWALRPPGRVCGSMLPWLVPVVRGTADERG